MVPLMDLSPISAAVDLQTRSQQKLGGALHVAFRTGHAQPQPATLRQFH